MRKASIGRCFRSAFLLLATLLIATGCATPKPLTLMPTPVLYEQEGIEPFSHVAPELRSPVTQVFYATNRSHRQHDPQRPYGNGVDDELHLGRASVYIGNPGADWEETVRLSMFNPPDSDVVVGLAEVTHWDSLVHRAADDVISWEEESHARFVREIRRELDHHVDKEIMLYVHGTATEFDKAVAMAGEIDHYAGKDFVGVAFSWPSHRNILYYLLRADVRRARHSSEALRDLIKLLAHETSATRINILCWSAGGRVVSKALHELRNRHPQLDGHGLQAEYRLGSIVFAAADVEVDRFLDRLPAISELSREVVITVTDADDALIAAKRFMGGADRIGTADAERAELEFIRQRHLDNVEIIDVSRGQDVRGFDITGHHYWYRHPWNSSDIILLMRTDLTAAERGLSVGEITGLWYLDDDYPDRVRAAARLALDEDW